MTKIELGGGGVSKCSWAETDVSTKKERMKSTQLEVGNSNKLLQMI